MGKFAVNANALGQPALHHRPGCTLEDAEFAVPLPSGGGQVALRKQKPSPLKSDLKINEAKEFHVDSDHLLVDRVRAVPAADANALRKPKLLAKNKSGDAKVDDRSVFVAIPYYLHADCVQSVPAADSHAERKQELDALRPSAMEPPQPKENMEEKIHHDLNEASRFRNEILVVLDRFWPQGGSSCLATQGANKQSKGLLFSISTALTLVSKSQNCQGLDRRRQIRHRWGERRRERLCCGSSRMYPIWV